jgi:hypothetical protein
MFELAVKKVDWYSFFGGFVNKRKGSGCDSASRFDAHRANNPAD